MNNILEFIGPFLPLVIIVVTFKPLHKFGVYFLGEVIPSFIKEMSERCEKNG